MISQQINAGADVLLLTVGDEFKSQRVAATGDTIGTRVVCTVESTVLGTGLAVGTEGSVPSVAGIAVGIARRSVKPTPVRVENDATGDGLTAAASAALPGEGRVALGLLCTYLLTVGDCEEREREESEFWKHCRMKNNFSEAELE